MFEDAQSLVSEVQEQTMNSARDFFGNSVGSLKSQLEDDRSQLQDLLDHLPDSQEDVRSQIQKLVGSYEDIEYMVEQAIQKQEVEGVVEQVVQQTRLGKEIEREAGETLQPVEHLPPDSTLLGEATDEQGRTVQRSVDESGDIMETKLDESGSPVGEDIAGTATDLPAEKESTNEEGHTVRTVEDESGKSINLTLDEEGKVLDLEVSDGMSKGPDATKAAGQKARELGVDLSHIEGSGIGGRITVKDVLDAAREA